MMENLPTCSVFAHAILPDYPAKIAGGAYKRLIGFALLPNIAMFYYLLSIRVSKLCRKFEDKCKFWVKG